MTTIDELVVALEKVHACELSRAWAAQHDTVEEVWEALIGEDTPDVWIEHAAGYDGRGEVTREWRDGSLWWLANTSRLDPTPLLPEEAPREMTAGDKLGWYRERYPWAVVEPLLEAWVARVKAGVAVPATEE